MRIPILLVLLSLLSIFALSGCIDPYYSGSGGGYNDPGYGNSGGGYNNGGYNNGGYNSGYDDSRERRELERERRRLDDERQRLEDERRRQERPVYRPPPPPPPAREQERCPSGYSPSENKCSQEERRRGCKDMRLPGGLGCVHR